MSGNCENVVLGGIKLAEDRSHKRLVLNNVYLRRAIQLSRTKPIQKEEEKDLPAPQENNHPKIVLPEVHGYNPRPAKIRVAHRSKQVPPVKVDDVKVVARPAPKTVYRRKQVQKPVDFVEGIIAKMNQPQEEARKRKAEIEDMKKAAQVKRRREAVNPAAKVLYEFPQEMLEFERQIGWA